MTEISVVMIFMLTICDVVKYDEVSGVLVVRPIRGLPSGPRG